MKTFVLNEDQAMIRELAQDLAQAVIRPISEKVDREGLCPTDALAAFAEAGFLGCAVPEDKGGAGLDWWSHICVLEEIAKECASTAWMVANSDELIECLVKCGTAQQQALVIPELVGGALGTVAGEDSAYGAVLAEAVKVEDGYVLNGKKLCVVNAGRSAWYLVAAREGEQLRWFLINGGDAGVQAEKAPAMLGLKGCAMGTLVFRDCRVSEDRLVAGAVETVLRGTQALDMAAIAEGVAQGALSEAAAYVNQRVQFGKTIAQFENTQQVMAEQMAKAEAARALVWEAVRVKDSGADYVGAAAMAKVVAADVAAVTTRKCVQFMGGYGYTREYPVERKMRDAKMSELFGGSSECQKYVIAKDLILQKNIQPRN